MSVDATPSPELLVEVTRRDLASNQQVVESRHAGHLVVVGPDGIAAALGDPEHLTFVRSAAKPFQAAASLAILAEHDEPLPASDQLAVGWASHRGEQRHLDAVAGLLERAGIDPDQLTCPPGIPEADPGADPARIQFNCSGKHALFALAGRSLGISGPDLLDPDGALQQRVLAEISTAMGTIHAVGTDGCGAPAVAVAVVGLARGFMQLITDARHLPIIRAGLEHPLLVGGEGRLESALLADGVVCKVGAEGVYGAAWTGADGSVWGIALKIEDGEVRGASAALHGALVALGVVTADVWRQEPPQGGGKPAGTIRAVAAVQQLADGLIDGDGHSPQR